MELELKHSGDEELIENILKFSGKIMFGVPEETANLRSKDGKASINNAQILAIMEAGSPVKNIPSRKLLEPVVIRHIDKIREIFNQIYDALVAGEESKVDKLMETLAQRMEMWTKSFFREDNGWDPNTKSTQHAKNRRAGKPLDSPVTPLIDTGSLRSSIRGIYIKK
ncbi:MAG: hypothetical protein RR342_01115 [Bacilli bacterium]|jgi:hypothetical protein